MPEEVTPHAAVAPAAANEPRPAAVAVAPAVVPAAAPALDHAKLTADITSRVVEGIGNMAREQAQRQESQRQEQARQQQAGLDPLTQMVAPIVGPAIQQVGVRAESAMDAAVFYADPDPRMTAFKSKHRDLVERSFNAEIAAGRFTPRDAILKYLRGGDLFKEVVAMEVESSKQAEAAALNAQTAGSGSPRTPGSQTPKDPWSMEPDELTKTLENVAF